MKRVVQVQRVLRMAMIVGVSIGLVGFGANTLAQGVSNVLPAQGGENGIAGFFLNLAQNYPWLATVLLVIGALRVVFKPVMALLDAYVKANCSAEEYARIQSFEAGPIYRWLCFGLDMVGSVKLPVIGIKPNESSKSSKI